MKKFPRLKMEKDELREYLVFKHRGKKVEAKKDAKERLEELRSGDKDKVHKDSDAVTITASSVEELISKINDYTFTLRSDSVQTDAEKMVGTHLDFRA